MVRGQPLFMLSVLLRGVAPHLREAAEVSNWQVTHHWQSSSCFLQVLSSPPTAPPTFLPVSPKFFLPSSSFFLDLPTSGFGVLLGMTPFA
jgi:hypothetical protein